MGNLNESKGQYGIAEQYFQEALVSFERAYGKEHIDYLKVLSNLADLNETIGRYEIAERLFLEVKAIQEKALGKSHAEYGRTLTKLAKLYTHVGRYEDAEPLAKEAVQVRRNILGEWHPSVASSLQTLGELYHDMGRFDLAEPLYLQAMDIRRKVLGVENNDYAWSLNNLANLYLVTGRLKESETLMLENRAIREKKLGKEHPEYCLSLINLGALYIEMNELEKAEPILLEAKALLDKLPNFQTHRFQVYVQSSIGLLHTMHGRYSEAESMLLKAKSTVETVFGKRHPEYGYSLNNLAQVYFLMGRVEDAEIHLLEAQQTQQALLASATRHLSEHELASYNKLFKKNFDKHFSYAQCFNKRSDLLPGICYDQALFQKGFLLVAASQLRTLSQVDSAANRASRLFASCNRRLARAYTMPSAERDSISVARLEEQANAAEKELIRTVAGYGQAIRQVAWQELLVNLKQGEAAIEFVYYKFDHPKQSDSTMYAALLLRPEWQFPKYIPLFEQKALDSLLRTSGVLKADYVNQLYTVAERGATEVNRPQTTLYELLWRPLENELSGVKTIYFSPSGLLHRLNMSAIPISDTETLADRHHFVQLGSTRQFVMPTTTQPARNDLALFGGIVYEPDTTALPTDSLDALVLQGRGEQTFVLSDSTLRAGSTWSYLPGSEREILAVGGVAKSAGMAVQVFSGRAATEEALKKIGTIGLPSPKVLHLATHGFFFPDPKNSYQQNSLSKEEPVFKRSDHPMIRSGLILANGNYAWQTGKSFHPNMEDGILTAYEISQMNLSNTELVVLSACETGLGDIQGNEGVYGLQRAFKIAGAKYLIMSLWQVPDKQTSLLMIEFYKKWLENKLPIPEAFRAAQQEMRERGLDPYQWAGFVLMR